MKAVLTSGIYARAGTMCEETGWVGARLCCQNEAYFQGSRRRWWLAMDATAERAHLVSITGMAGPILRALFKRLIHFVAIHFSTMGNLDVLMKHMLLYI